jgi:hypothetical protein
MDYNKFKFNLKDRVSWTDKRETITGTIINRYQAYNNQNCYTIVVPEKKHRYSRFEIQLRITE